MASRRRRRAVDHPPAIADGLATLLGRDRGRTAWWRSTDNRVMPAATVRELELPQGETWIYIRGLQTRGYGYEATPLDRANLQYWRETYGAEEAADVAAFAIPLEQALRARREGTEPDDFERATWIDIDGDVVVGAERVTDAMREDLDRFDAGHIFDEDLWSTLEHEDQAEQWGNWGRDDFIRELTRQAELRTTWPRLDPEGSQQIWLTVENSNAGVLRVVEDLTVDEADGLRWEAETATGQYPEGSDASLSFPLVKWARWIMATLEVPADLANLVKRDRASLAILADALEERGLAAQAADARSLAGQTYELTTPRYVVVDGPGPVQRLNPKRKSRKSRRSKRKPSVPEPKPETRTKRGIVDSALSVGGAGYKGGKAAHAKLKAKADEAARLAAMTASPAAGAAMHARNPRPIPPLDPKRSARAHTRNMRTLRKAGFTLHEARTICANPPKAKAPPKPKASKRHRAGDAVVRGSVISARALRHRAAKDEAQTSAERRGREERAVSRTEERTGKTRPNPSKTDRDAAIAHYIKLHWGDKGEVESYQCSAVTIPPTHGTLVLLGAMTRCLYTTVKDEGIIDYDHEFGEGASGAWEPPALVVHHCERAKCPERGKLALVDGTYTVNARGIVG